MTKREELIVMQEIAKLGEQHVWKTDRFAVTRIGRLAIRDHTEQA